MLLRAAVDESEGEKPEVEQSFTALLFPQVIHSTEQKRTYSERP